MTHMQFTFFALLFAVALAGVVTADVTMQAGAAGSGSVYTTGNIYVSSVPGVNSCECPPSSMAEAPAGAELT